MSCTAKNHVKNKYSSPLLFQFVPLFLFYYCKGRSGKNAVGSWNKVTLLKILPSEKEGNREGRV